MPARPARSTVLGTCVRVAVVVALLLCEVPGLDTHAVAGTRGAGYWTAAVAAETGADHDHCALTALVPAPASVDAAMPATPTSLAAAVHRTPESGYVPQPMARARPPLPPLPSAALVKQGVSLLI